MCCVKRGKAYLNTRNVSELLELVTNVKYRNDNWATSPKALRPAISFFDVTQHPKLAFTALLFRFRDHTQSQDSSQRVISSSQRPLPARQTQETNIHVLSGIRTRSPRNQYVADLRLRQRDHWDRPAHITNQEHYFSIYI